MDESKTKKYGIVPFLPADARLNSFDWAVWAALATYAHWDTSSGKPVMKVGTCFPSVPTIAKAARMGVRSVQAVLKRLQEYGYLSVMPQYGTKGGRTVNDYLLLPEGGERDGKQG